MSAKPEFPHERVRVFSRQAALCLEATTLSKDDGALALTLNLQVAAMPNPGDPQWQTGINIQLAHHELPLLAAVLTGQLPDAAFVRPNKSVTLIRQPSKLFVKGTMENGPATALPVQIGDVHRLGVLAMHRLHQASGGLAPELLWNVLRGAAALCRTRPP